MNLVTPMTNPRYKVHYPQEDTRSLGFLCSSQLPPVTNLDIFSLSGLVKADIQLVRQVEMTARELQLVERFHQYLFTTVLQSTSLLDYFRQSSPLLVPLLGSDKLDFSICQKVVNHSLATSSVRIDTKALCNVLEEDKHLYLDLVISPLVLSISGPNYYFVEEIMKNMTVSDTMPGMGMSWVSYFKIHHKIDIKDKNQPLVRIAAGDRKDYMLVEGGEPVADGKVRSHHSYKVPELMGVEPVSSGLWKQIQIVPWVMYRLSCLLAAKPLTLSSYIENMSLKEETELRSPKDQFSRLLSSRSLGLVPAVGQVVRALTLPAAGDPWNMERMEILGDSFLKYSTTAFLYNKRNNILHDEGNMTLARSKIVGNRHLFHVAKNLGLASCGIVSCRMDPMSSWCPPGFWSITVGEDTLEDIIVKMDNILVKNDQWGRGDLRRWINVEDLQKLVTGEVGEIDLVEMARDRRNRQDREGLGAGVELRNYRLVSDKSQADCVESLIGCHLLTSGISGALKFMTSVGLDLINLSPCKRDAFVSESSRKEVERFELLLKKLGSSDIEEIAGYVFREKSFLLQAFTHPSYGDNRLTESYETLEFLGDAVLDYIVTCYIYTHSTADPGQVTDIRSALVNNNTFADLLTEQGLDKYILHCTPGLYGKIRDYLDTKLWYQGNKEGKIESNLKLINEEEPPELEMVEVPKVLGDVFESLMGAIYLDCGFNLETVWKVYRKLCPDLDSVLDNPPLNLKKQLMELFPHAGSVSFTKPKVHEGSHMVTVTVSVPAIGGGNRHFVGRGRNKKMAEMAACKCALRNVSPH